jgi:pilus assembly protein Flp/PilA
MIDLIRSMRDRKRAQCFEGTSMMKVLCTRAAKCESGATAMEYALTAAILSVVLLTGADTLGSVVNDSFMSMSKTLEMTATTGGQSGGGTKLVSAQFASVEQSFESTSSSSSMPQP